MLERDYQLLLHLNSMSDDSLVTAAEVAAVLGLSAVTVQQRKVPTLPPPIPDFRCQRWVLGAIRRWIRERSASGPSSESPLRTQA